MEIYNSLIVIILTSVTKDQGAQTGAGLRRT